MNSVTSEITDSRDGLAAASLGAVPRVTLAARLKRHPFTVTAYFRHSLVITYALPATVLEPLLPPGLVLDTWNGLGFLAIAMVQTERLRPAFLPPALGQNFFLSGYRIFTRFTDSTGRCLRGLRILRSDTDRPLMKRFGNLLTHYNYQLADVNFTANSKSIEARITTPNAEADLHIRAALDCIPTAPPPGSPFSNLREARLFSGPLPFTFDYEPESHSLIIIEGVRRNWKPMPVNAEILQNTFLERPPFNRAVPRLANAFLVRDVPYLWKRGRVQPLG
jgi:hypothetical protein